MARAVSIIRLFAAASLAAAFAMPVTAPAQQQPTTERPLKPEKNPPGDIPDNQVFIDYTSPLGFSLKIPEGWARRDLGDGAEFTDKYGRITITQTTADAAPDVAAARETLVPKLQRDARAVTIKRLKPVKLPAGPALLISYDSNSDPNPVTNKAIRLENDRYYFWKDGKLMTLSFAAPAGADNADQWDMMAKSFRWR